MLIRHARFLANVSVPASKELVKDFSKVLDALEDNPFQFPVETEYDLPPGQFHKALFYKRYKALFCAEGKNVYLDAVLDCREDNSKYWATKGGAGHYGGPVRSGTRDGDP